MQVDRVAIAAERQRFLDSELDVVHVKTWPWVPGERQFGTLDMVPLRTGEMLVVLNANGDEELYGDLDRLLQKWSGD